MAGRNISAYVQNKNFPDVVAPKDILRPQYEAVAWTQRVLFLDSPDERLLANPSLGLPDVSQVVRQIFFDGRQALTT
jgi:sacsin